jgi:hypothetical protein
MNAIEVGFSLVLVVLYKYSNNLILVILPAYTAYKDVRDST